jgi:hypothetical protein
MGPYVPAAYRSYPFALAKADNGQFVLCVDADSDLVGEGHAEAFFDEQGEPSQSVKGILDFLQQIRANREATIRICAALNAENLIQPWPITLKHKDGEQTAQGLCRIDEARFNSLDADALRRVQQAGALAVAYCQLLSMQHLQTLGKLAEAHAGANGQLSSTSNGELDLEFLNSNDTLSFGPH